MNNPIAELLAVDRSNLQLVQCAANRVVKWKKPNRCEIKSTWRSSVCIWSQRMSNGHAKTKAKKNIAWSVLSAKLKGWWTGSLGGGKSCHNQISWGFWTWFCEIHSEFGCTTSFWYFWSKGCHLVVSGGVTCISIGGAYDNAWSSVIVVRFWWF